MKKIITIATALIFGCCAFAQSEPKPYKSLKEFDYKPKEYLKYNFQERKELYVGKPLSELLKDCEVPILSLLDGPGGYKMEYPDTDFFFEDEKTTSYRNRNRQNSVSISIRWQTPLNIDVVDKRFLTYGDNWNMINKAFYETQVVGDIVVVGKNFSDLPPLPDFTKGDTTPCCAPTPVGVRNQQEGDERQSTNADITRTLGVIDTAPSVESAACQCDMLSSAKTQNNLPPDSTTLQTLLDVAKDSRLVHSIMVDERFYTRSYRSFKCPLKKGVPGFVVNYCNNHKATLQTVPAPLYGYTFVAPTGYDFYTFVRNRQQNNMSDTGFIKYHTDAFFVGYDGSISNLHLKGNRVDVPGTSAQNIIFNTSDFSKIASFSSCANNVFLPCSSDDLQLKWGFVRGGRLTDEFLDCFRRLYQEGEHFSKEDAYNAAFAYILESRGIELYRRAPEATDFKRYNTTPVKDASGKITGFYSTVWQ